MFPCNANGRKLQSTLGGILDQEGCEVLDFDGLTNMQMNHFRGIFQETQGINIIEIIKVTQLFPSFVDVA